MLRFVFRLQPLLRARRQTEQGKQRAVAELERQRMQIEDNLRNQQEWITQNKRQMSDRLVGQLDLGELRDHAGATLRLMRDAQRMALELAGIYKRVEAARAELLEATKQRRALELLRDNRFAQWRYELEHAESAALDELAVIQAARKDAV